MDLIKINDNKLKIMLTPVDMKDYALNAQTMDYTQSETRRAFRTILDEAKSRTGFDASGDKIYVQFYPSREGGCELFVTKLGLLCSMQDSSERPPLIRGRTSPAAQSKSSHNDDGERNRTVAFTFDTLDNLILVCRHLRKNAFGGDSAAFHGEEGRYYLLLSDTAGALPLFFLAFISEYGIRENADAVRLYIREHAQPICEAHAIERLSTL